MRQTYLLPVYHLNKGPQITSCILHVLQNSLFSYELDHKLTATGYSKLGKKLTELIAAGGYPSALNRTSASRRMSWYKDFTNTLIQRDIKDIASIQHINVMPKLLRLCASQTA
jgi:hypothetical protein